MEAWTLHPVRVEMSQLLRGSRPGNELCSASIAGRIATVADAFLAAGNQVSVEEIRSLLGKTKYTYPYHQAIGFLLERAAVSQFELEPLRRMPLRFNVYLDYGMKRKSYDESWKLYYPP